ncbi:MAG TPA: 1,4-dihydroxy-6-naphthoate synthase [Frankiaceae bacterium]|jgi:1,4-dihydroxy-6-naphthoate synthase|nr:1,4-dihydroxy-6-naphthoate synthase [Frankiaceae bacterium]
MTDFPSPLEVAFSPCPNDTFAFHAWVAGLVSDAPPAEVSFADIDVLNGWAAAGRGDVIKVSYAALPALLADYALLPSGGALGRGCGPLVVTAGRDSLAGATVAIPGRQTTAYLLFRLWAQEQGVASIEVLPFDKIMPAVAEGSVDAGLIIHESRFTYPSYGLQAIVDLGDWWEGDTGLPIPLGAILARRTFRAERISRLSRVIRESVEAAWADPAASRAYVLAHSQEMAPDVVDQHIALYVNSFTADLGDEGYAAISGLLDRAAAAGLTGALTGPLR